MAEGTGYHLTIRTLGEGKQGSILVDSTYPFNVAGREEMKRDMQVMVESYETDVIARGSRSAWPYQDTQWYCVKYRSEVRFFGRRRMSESNRLFLDIAMGRINEDEMYDTLAETKGLA